MKKENSSNRIKFTEKETMDAIPILDSNSEITEIMPALPEKLSEKANKLNSNNTEKKPKDESVSEKVSKDKSNSQNSEEKITIPSEVIENKENDPVKITQNIKKDSSSKLEATKEVTVSKFNGVSGKGENNDFKPTSKAKYSLQLKMMLVISLVIVITVSVIITLATHFFKKDSRVRIEENNLELLRIVKSKVLTDLVAEINKAKILALTLKQEFKTKSQKQFFIDQYFKNDNSFIYLGVYKNKEGSMQVVDSIFNQEYLKKISLSEEDILAPVNRNLSHFIQSFDGVPTVINSSPGFQEPSITVSIPIEEGEKSEFVLVILLKSERILDAFKKSGINTTFMVNGEGIVLAHSDPSLVLSAKNLMAHPMVRYMLTSNKNNELKPYEDEEKGKFLGFFYKLGFANIGIVSTVEEELAFKPVYQIQERNILIMIIAACVSLIIVFVFAKTISNPVLRLLDETIKISKGIFQLDIKRTTNDEVGVLTDYFQTMAKGLEEREKVKSMLGSMIDPVVVAEGMKDLAALKRGDEKRITAFFSDVAGFSAISEQLNSVQLAALLNEYLSAMTNILKLHEGVLDKYIGDAIVGIFGAPVNIEDHFLKAARASLEMIEKLKDLRAYWVKNNSYSQEAQEMDIRIGLNTGLAKVGFMGTDAMGSYTMMGDTVNLAARLEAAAKDYGVNILISESVNTLIHTEMFTRELDKVRVKGKNEPVKLYELISLQSGILPNIKESTELYHEAMTKYFEQEWDAAVKLFQNSEKARGSEDKAVLALVDRCNYYKKSPPGDSWDGVFTRKHK